MLMANLSDDSMLDEHVDHLSNIPLQITIRYGVATFLSHCDPNKINDEGLSCLHLAAEHGHLLHDNPHTEHSCQTIA